MILTGGVSSSVLGWVCYDHQTQHKMRKMSPWRPEESFVRLLNATIHNSTEFSLPQMKHYNGIDTRQVHFSAKG